MDRQIPRCLENKEEKCGYPYKAHFFHSRNSTEMNAILRLILMRFLAYLGFLNMRTLHVQ